MIHFEDVRFSYQDRLILSDINFSIKKGEFVYLIGESGAGKSSILKMIYMDEFPNEGNIAVAEFDYKSMRKKELPLLRRKVGVVFQDFKLLPDRTIYENIAFILEVTGTHKSFIPKKIEKVLSDVSLEMADNKYPHELSGGEQQRIAIARAIVNEPYVLVADEPTGNLDPKVASEIMDLLVKINKRGTAIVMATHNYELIEKYPYRVLEVKHGKVLEK